jgi:hypothetical protein
MTNLERRLRNLGSVIHRFERSDSSYGEMAGVLGSGNVFIHDRQTKLHAFSAERFPRRAPELR